MVADWDERDRWLAWSRPVVLCGVLAFCVASLTWGPGKAVLLVTPVMFGVSVAGMVYVLATNTRENARPLGVTSTLRSALGWWCHIAAACSAVVLVLAVVSVLSPWCVLLAIAALALTTPPARIWVQVWARTHLRDRAAVHEPQGRPASRSPDRQPGHGPVGALDTSSRTAELDTAELCHLWRVTFWMVRDLRAPIRTLHVVQLRQEVLDELERRHPVEVVLWLRSGRHGADGPARFL